MTEPAVLATDAGLRCCQNHDVTSGAAKELTVRLEQTIVMHGLLRYVDYLSLSFIFAASCETSSSVVRVGAGTGPGFDIQMASSVTPEE